MAEISTRITSVDCRLLTITGPGGVGKTRLALQVAADVADHFTHGVHFVPLQAVPSPRHLDAQLADYLQLSLSGQISPEEQLIAYLHDKHLLLVLDNFEHLVERAPLLSALLAASPHLTILLTSRELLSLQEEWIYPVWGMQVPPEEETHAEEMRAEEYDAVRFFAERARQVNPQFSLSNERTAVIRICRLVEGIPLALELAASWVSSLSCEAIVAEIRDNLGFLASSLRNIPERHRSMRAVFDQSWKHLTQEEQDVFKRLSVFRGTFRRQAAEDVAAATLTTLSALVNKSLLQWDARGRYHLHELLRQYAEERLLASPEAADVRDWHCAYFARFLRRRLDDIHAGRQVDAMHEMEAELDNLRTAWHWAVTQDRIDAIRSSLYAITWFWHYRSRYLEASDALRAAIRTLEAGEPVGERAIALAEVLSQFGWICIRLGQLGEAADHFERAHALYSQLNVAPTSDSGSDPQTGLAMLAILKGDVAQGIRRIEEARRQQEARGDRRNLYTTDYVLTSALVAQGDYQQARQCAHQAYQLALELNDRWSLAYTLNDLGLITHLLGAHEEAQQHFRASYAIRRQYNDREGMAVALRQLGHVARRLQNVGEAKRLYRESLTLYQGLGDQGGLAATLEGLGAVERSQGNHAEAAAHLLRALRIVARIQLLSHTFSVLTTIAELLLDLGRTEQAGRTLLLVCSHPSSPREARERAKDLLASCPDLLPSAHHANARSQHDLAALIADLQPTLTILPELHPTEAPRAERTPPAQAGPSGQPLVEPLTPREIDVLQRMAHGLTNQQIAEEMIVALGTVKSYTSRIYGKLGVQNRVQAIERARQLKLI